YRQIDQCASEVYKRPTLLDDAKSISDVLRLTGAQYFTNGLVDLERIEADSVTFLFSHVVREHIRKSEFRRVMANCHRILKPGGIASHRVDFQDHLGGSIHNLRFSERVWESRLFAESGFYTNRIRFSQMISVFREVG